MLVIRNLPGFFDMSKVLLYLLVCVTPALAGCVELRSDQRTPSIMRFATEIVAPGRIALSSKDGSYLSVTDPYAYSDKAREIFIDGKGIGAFSDQTGEKAVHKLLAGFKDLRTLDDSRQQIDQYEYRLLKDGRLFLCGGKDSLGRSSACSWIFDSRSRKLIRGPALELARSSHLLTLLSDGRVLISGGIKAPGKRRSELEIFDPETNSILEVCKLLKPRCHHQAVELKNGKVLIISGETDKDLHDAGESLTSTIEIVDVKEGTSKILGQLHNARRFFDVFSRASSLFVVGGEMDGYFDGPGDSSVLTVEEYKY